MTKRGGGSGHGLRGILSRLRRDVRGNILILTAAMLIPLLALVGSAIDLGRIYVAKNRLQVACDAASLAGRRAVTAGQTTAQVSAEAIKFFNFNFPAASYDTATFTPTVAVTGSTTKVVVVTAATTLPMSVMKLFGFTTQPLSVTCDAQQDFVNTDIVLVLDTTGSMADKAVSSDTVSKIQGLRNAVMAFYAQLAPIQAQLAAANLRMRIGIVPYSSSVNVGGLIRATSPSYMASTWNYQSRQIVKDTRNQNSCNNKNGLYNSGQCSYFTYGTFPTPVDVSKYVAGSQVDVTPLIGNDTSKGLTPSTSGSSQKTSWAGCIEERTTTRMSGTATSIDPAATDLDIDLVPTTDANRWHPYWPELEFIPISYGIDPSEMYKPQYACPAAAAGMQWWSQSDLQAYVNSLNPDGGTYHDNGMRWGMRLASPGGIFGTGNPTTYNGLPVKRYIVFMTDGLFDTGYNTLYSTYGVEQYDARVTPGGNSSNETDQLARHQKRFDLLCSAAKSDPFDYNIWVVGFAQTLDSHLTNCASNPGQASTASNSDDLIAKFAQIGQAIGALRLTQ